MPTIDDAKAMAKHLRTALAHRDIPLPHAACLEIVAAQIGQRDWNTAAATLSRTGATGIAFVQTIPILRIFDVAKAREFYCDFLGFAVTMEHRFEPDLPLYMAVERAGLALHLSEHHGDASPGSTVFVQMHEIAAFHAELSAKGYGYARPGLTREPWGTQMEVPDPFGNRIRFCEKHR